MKVPGQRKPGQVGGRGGHGKNMHNAQKRDTAPTGGKFPTLAVVIFVVVAIVALSSLAF